MISSMDCYFLDFTGNSTQFQDSLKIITCVVNSLLIVPTILSNGLVIATIWRNPSLHSSPSNILLLCLACSDFLNGLITQPMEVIHVVGELTLNEHLFCVPGVVMESTAWFASGISGTTVLALSVDRFLAVTMHLRYSHFVTVFRTSMFVIAIWPLFSVNAFARVIGVTNYTFLLTNVIIILLCLVTILLIYYKIFRVINRHRVQIQSQMSSVAQFSGSSTTTEELKSNKSLLTVVYIVGLFWLCYLPFACVIVIYLVTGKSSSLRTAYAVTGTLVFANSIINPGLYCWRISEIRQAFMKYIGHTKVNISLSGRINSKNK